MSVEIQLIMCNVCVGSAKLKAFIIFSKKGKFRISKSMKHKLILWMIKVKLLSIFMLIIGCFWWLRVLAYIEYVSLKMSGSSAREKSIDCLL